VQAVAAIASLLVTLILAGLTYAIVKENRRMADQMAQQGDPIVVGRIDPNGELYAQYVLTNVGLGPARNVELKLRVDHEAVWRDTILLPGKSQYFFLPVDGGVQNTSFNELRNNKKILSSAFSFEDRAGRKFPLTEATVDFQQLTADWDHAHWQLRKPEVLQAADELKKAIDDLTKASRRGERPSENSRSSTDHADRACGSRRHDRERCQRPSVYGRGTLAASDGGLRPGR